MKVDEALKRDVLKLADQLNMTPEELRMERFFRASHPQIAKALLDERVGPTWGMEAMTTRDWERMKQVMTPWLNPGNAPNCVDEWYHHIHYVHRDLEQLVMEYLSMVLVDYVDAAGQEHYGITYLSDIRSRRLGGPFFRAAINWAKSVRAGKVERENLTPWQAEQTIKGMFLEL